jgi:hypothetical protein
VAWHDGEMNDESCRQRAIASVEATIAASERLRGCLSVNESVGREMIQQLHAGVPISGSVAASGNEASDLRSGMNEILDDFERCRHRMRMAFVLPSLSEGMSIGAIGRALGVSRQRAARLVHEANAGLATADGA